jgi:hypothetical protein
VQDDDTSKSATIASGSQDDSEFPNILQGLGKDLGGVTLSDTKDSGVAGLEGDANRRTGEDGEKDAQGLDGTRS